MHDYPTTEHAADQGIYLGSCEWETPSGAVVAA